MCSPFKPRICECFLCIAKFANPCFSIMAIELELSSDWFKDSVSEYGMNHVEQHGIYPMLPLITYSAELQSVLLFTTSIFILIEVKTVHSHLNNPFNC